MATPTVSIFMQDACYQHRFIRSNDLSAIVERPERLRAVKIGLSAAISRLEDVVMSNKPDSIHHSLNSGTDIADALRKLDIAQEKRPNVVQLVNSNASSNILNNKAVKYVHGDIEGDVYLENLAKWIKESSDKIKDGESEIPSHLSQGDLYLCPDSLNAIQGALGTVCEAVDSVVDSSRNPSSSNPRAAFVAVRPPGHHCGENTPCGFCFVNNVVVAAAHAHLVHKIKKIVILDIDLHHGNGTQSLVWQVNEESYRQTLECEASENPNPPAPGPQIFYGSLHDVLSYPCEDGNVSMVQAASVSIHGPHGQYIENIHLQPYNSDADFWERLYPSYHSKLFGKAEKFIGMTPDDEVMIFISCGFDACEHEYSSMSRHGRKVPASFYHRFAADTLLFAKKVAKGKLMSVLEGGYSDRALISGAFAHLCGLVDTTVLGVKVDDAWWDVDKLISLEKATKKRRGGRVSQATPIEPWIDRANSIFQSIETVIIPTSSKASIIPPSSMTLRERKPASTAAQSGTSLGLTKAKMKNEEQPLSGSESLDNIVENLQNLGLTESESSTNGSMEFRKLPRVILKVKDPQII